MESVAKYSVQNEHEEHEKDQEMDTAKSNINYDEAHSPENMAMPEHVTKDFYYHPCDVFPDDDCNRTSTDESRNSTACSTDKFYDGLLELNSQSLDKIQLETKQRADEDGSLSSSISNISLCSSDSDLSLPAQVEANREDCQTDTRSKSVSEGMIESLIGYFNDKNNVKKEETTNEPQSPYQSKIARTFSQDSKEQKDENCSLNSPSLVSSLTKSLTSSPMNPVYLISPIFSPLRAMVSSFQNSSGCTDNVESSEKSSRKSTTLASSDDEGNIGLNVNDSDDFRDNCPDAENTKEHLSNCSDSGLSTNENKHECREEQKDPSGASDTETDMEGENEAGETFDDVQYDHLLNEVTNGIDFTGKRDDREETERNKYKNTIIEDRKCGKNPDSAHRRRGYACSYRNKYFKGGKAVSRKFSSERGLKKDLSHNCSKQNKQRNIIGKDIPEKHTLKRSKSTPKIEKFYFDENNMLVKES